MLSDLEPVVISIVEEGPLNPWDSKGPYDLDRNNIYVLFRNNPLHILFNDHVEMQSLMRFTLQV